MCLRVVFWVLRGLLRFNIIFFKNCKGDTKACNCLYRNVETSSCFHKLWKVRWGQIILSINLKAGIKFSGKTIVMQAGILMGPKILKVLVFSVLMKIWITNRHSDKKQRIWQLRNLPEDYYSIESAQQTFGTLQVWNRRFNQSPSIYKEVLKFYSWV